VKTSHDEGEEQEAVTCIEAARPPNVVAEAVEKSTTAQEATSNDAPPPGNGKPINGKQNTAGIAPVPELPTWFLKHNIKVGTPKQHSFYFPVLPGASFTDLDASEFEVVKKGAHSRGASLQNTDVKAAIPAEDVTDPRIVKYRIAEEVMSEIMSTCAMSLFPASQKAKELFPSSKAHLVLQCPAEGAHIFMDKVVMKVADLLEANLVILGPQDMSQLSSQYILEGPDANRNAFWTLGYETGPFVGRSEDGRPIEEDMEEDEEEDDMDDDAPSMSFGGGRSTGSPFMGFLADGGALKKLLSAGRLRPGNSGRPDSAVKLRTAETSAKGLRAQQNKDKLSSLLNAILNVPPTGPTRAEESQEEPKKKTIIYIQNIKELQDTTYGSRIVSKLSEMVNSRRAAGERIMLIGASISSPPDGGYRDFMESMHEDPQANFRSIIVTPLPQLEAATADKVLDHDMRTWHKVGPEIGNPDTLRRLMEINFRNVYNMVCRLQPGMRGLASIHDCADFFRELVAQSQHNDARNLLKRAHSHVWSVDEVHRLVSLAIGQRISRKPEDADTYGIETEDVLSALSIVFESDKAKTHWIAMAEANRKGVAGPSSVKSSMQKGNEPTSDQLAQQDHEAKMKEITASANRREKQLLRGVVNAQDIRVGFDDVHATDETKEALKTVTTLALTRPDAFKYGVLANDKISGLLLYGPPGTGKTMLAKAVAKQSGATMLTVSGSDIYNMFVGEGEKNVRAVFSLAKKLAPTVVFLDEGDAILGSRGGSTERRSHRELINEFLKEWDGMNETTAFIMVATNRPFDLDDAVLRRLPRKILVDLPSEKDRESILRLHLKDESIEEDVSVAKLAEQTPLYSGSDLKNVAVSAALAAVREENEQAERLGSGGEKKYPDRRTLKQKHFDTALQEISASVNEDMGSLKAIKQFDEKYGDGKGRKKKTGYGFVSGLASKVETPKVRSASA
jgi:SpoVK/Ycf46/Vps4 family AAA+-type ATPase